MIISLASAVAERGEQASSGTIGGHLDEAPWLAAARSLPDSWRTAVRRPTPVLAALLAVAVAACGEASPDTPLAPAAGVNAALTVQQTEALGELTRAVALALNDAGLRQRVKNDMRLAPYSEHKLVLADYLRGSSGGIVLAKMVRETGRSRTELLDLLRRVGPVEFYMPVAAHRESWTGGAELQVAGSLDEANTTLVGFDLAGRPVALSPVVAPETPTLVIVPVETDFTRALDPANSHNVNDRGGQAIGTLVPGAPRPSANRGPRMQMCYVDCGGGGDGGGGGTATVQQRGISVEEMISHMKATNDHEPWDKGAPEFYLLLGGTQSSGASYEKRINVPESVWDGSNDSGNAQWRDVGALSLIVWDVDLGSRIRVQCKESDATINATIKLTGTTTFKDLNNLTLAIDVSMGVSDGDDDCGSNYIDMRNSAGDWYWIPNGVDDDLTNPTIPYLNGTSDLQWYGYGLPRI